MSEELQDAVAIVGMSVRLPGARDLDAYWSNLAAGVESVRPLSPDALARLDPARRADPTWVKAASVLDDMECFDAAFFGFAPAEAALIDPQHRHFLELCWEALENAAIAPTSLGGSATGVFGGASTNTYLAYNLLSRPDLVGTLDPMVIDVANGADFLCTRVAHKLDLRGPAVSVATACSTSLVAVHLACQSLIEEQCDLALAGGVSVQVRHPEGYRYTSGSIASPDGHCRPFDASAAGTVFGSGGGVVVLKRLADAIADGDFVHAVIRGSAVNNDGSRKVGYTAPGVEGQAAVIREALGVAGVPASSVGYVEAHGTGTKMGDPIELLALAKAFRAKVDGPPCVVGSVKGSVGHLSGAAGVASLVKAVLALRHGEVPGTVGYRSPNPELALADTPFRISGERQPWPDRGGQPRRAGVSSFGVGGTNAHVVLEEHTRPLARPSADESGSGPRVFVLSGRTAEALEAGAGRLARWLEAHPEAALADVACTLATGRATEPHRRAIVAGDRAGLLAALRGTTPDVPATAPATLAGAARGWVASGVALETKEGRRIPMPGTVFARVRHWVEAAGVASASPFTTTSAAAEPEPPSAPRQPRPNLETPFALPRSREEEAVARAVSEVLGLEAVGIDDNFFDLGGTSLLAIQVEKKVRAALGAEIPAAALYERPTVRALVAGLAADGDDEDTARAAELARRKEELAARNARLRRR